jgi:cytidylate kinase
LTGATQHVPYCPPTVLKEIFMAIITISGGCFSHGKEIAENVAKALNYQCVTQEIIVTEASRFFHIPEGRLMESIHCAPTILERTTHARERFLLSIKAAFLENVKRDNVVYHGHMGHFLIPGITHVLKVLVIAEMEDRIALLQNKREMTRSQALDLIKEEDDCRADWNHYTCQAHMNDPQLYDIVVHIGKLKIQDACNLICTAAKSETCRATAESEKALQNLALSSHVKAALQDICKPEVTSDQGVVYIKIQAQKLKKTGLASPKLQQQIKEKIREDLRQQVEGVVRKIPGVNDVFCDIGLPYYS